MELVFLERAKPNSSGTTKTITTPTGGTAEEEHENMLKWLGEHQNLSVSVSVFVPVRRYGTKEKRLNELFAYPSTPLRLSKGYAHSVLIKSNGLLESSFFLSSL